MNQNISRLLSKTIVPVVGLAILVWYHVGTQVVVNAHLSYLFITPVSIVLVISIMATVIQEYREWRTTLKTEVRSGQSTPASPRTGFREMLKTNRQTGIIIMTFAYILILPVLGTLLSTVAALSCGMYYLGVRKPSVLVLVSVGISVFVVCLFQVWLGVPLPWGVLQNLQFIL